MKREQFLDDCSGWIGARTSGPCCAENADCKTADFAYIQKARERSAKHFA